jgi:hypothetical protein
MPFSHLYRGCAISFRFPAGALLTAALSACGGGDPATAASVPPAQAITQERFVRLEGCVVDQYFIQRERVPVRARDSGGRVLGTASSGQRGEVVFTVPAGMDVRLEVDAEAGEALRVPALHRETIVETCLMARAEY